jgi:hypothetical protein
MAPLVRTLGVIFVFTQEQLMHYLRIMQLTNMACGLQGDIDTVNNLKDIQISIAEFVNLAYYDIQVMRDDWKFMQGTLDTHITPASYTITNADVGRWNKLYYSNKEVRRYDYEGYLNSDWTSAPGPPRMYTIIPETNGVVFNTPDQPYAIRARYVRVPLTLSNDSDIPIIPVRFHTVLVYKAAADFGSWLGNPEIEDRNMTKYDTLLLQLKRSEIPSKTVNIVPMA